MAKGPDFFGLFCLDFFPPWDYPGTGHFNTLDPHKMLQIKGAIPICTELNLISAHFIVLGLLTGCGVARLGAEAEPQDRNKLVRVTPLGFSSTVPEDR